MSQGVTTPLRELTREELNEAVARTPASGKHRGVVAIAAVAFVTILLASIALVIANSWYLSDNNGTVGIYQGVTGDVFGIPLSRLAETSSVQVSDLPSSIQDNLKRGLALGSEEEARNTLESYRDQINADKSDRSVTVSRTLLGTEISPDNPATHDDSQKGSGD